MSERQLQDRVTSEGNQLRFVRRVVEGGQVWGLKGAGGRAISDSLESSERRSCPSGPIARTVRLMSRKRSANKKPTHAIDAVLGRNMAALTVAVQNDGAVNEIDTDGRTPLHHAAIQGDEAAVGLLLEHGSQVDAQDREGWTALHFAANGYQTKVADLLLGHRAAVDIEDTNGNTPLFRAVFDSRGRGDLIRMLVAAGADRERKNKHGMSPVDLAGTIANYDLKKLLT